MGRALNTCNDGHILAPVVLLVDDHLELRAKQSERLWCESIVVNICSHPLRTRRRVFSSTLPTIGTTVQTHVGEAIKLGQVGVAHEEPIKRVLDQGIGAVHQLGAPGAWHIAGFSGHYGGRSDCFGCCGAGAARRGLGHSALRGKASGQRVKH